MPSILYVRLLFFSWQWIYDRVLIRQYHSKYYILSPSMAGRVLNHTRLLNDSNILYYIVIMYFSFCVYKGKYPNNPSRRYRPHTAGRRWSYKFGSLNHYNLKYFSHPPLSLTHTHTPSLSLLLSHSHRLPLYLTRNSVFYLTLNRLGHCVPNYWKGLIRTAPVDFRSL